METDLDRELEYKRRELRWVRENPRYIIGIGLDQWKKEQELVVEVAFLLRLRRLRRSEHRIDRNEEE
jgi:hypothetical protein